MRRKTIDIRAIIMMSFGLVAVVLIMVQMRLSAPKPPAEIKKLAERRIGIIDSTYIHLPFLFSIKMPSRKWIISSIPHDTTLVPLQRNKSFDDQITWLMSSHRIEKKDTLAVTHIGVFATTNPAGILYRGPDRYPS